MIWLPYESHNDGYYSETQMGNPQVGAGDHILDTKLLMMHVLIATGLPYQSLAFQKKTESEWEVFSSGSLTDEWVLQGDVTSEDFELQLSSLGSSEQKLLGFIINSDGQVRTSNSDYEIGESVQLHVYLSSLRGRTTAFSLRKDIQELQQTASTLTADKETLEGKVSTLESDSSTLNATVSTLESDNATLNTTVSQLEEDITNLSTANSTLEGQVSTLESDNVSLNTTVSGLETDLGSLSSANDTLSSTVSTLEGNVATLTSDKEALEGQVSTLESTIGDLTTRLEALENPTNPE